MNAWSARHRCGAVLFLAVMSACGLAEPTARPEAPPTEAIPQASTADRRPTVEIGHTMGAEEAPVLVVEFSDFGCRACADFATETLPALRREFVDGGEVRWRYVPIRQGFFRGAEAARAAECAAQQGEFWRMHDVLLARQHEWQSRGDPFRVLAGYARQIVADPERFDSCYHSDATDATLRLHDLVALSMGVRGIPVFLVGNQRVIGALETGHFARILRNEVEARRAEESRD